MKVINKSGLPLIDYRKLVPFQGELKFLSKDNYNKLLLSMEENGFFVPMFIWFDDDKPYVLDAHQRLRVLTHEAIEFENTGFNVPYVEVSADSREDAATKLLLLSSQYGTITQEGLDEYIAKFELPDMDIKELTNFDGIFEFPTLPQEPEQKDTPEVELDIEVDAIEGETYILGPHRIKCGTDKGELPPEKVDAYRKKYHKIVTGGEDGWQSGTPVES